MLINQLPFFPRDNHGKDSDTGTAGFTLIEMVLAVSIFAMIIVVIFSSFRVGIRSWERGERNIEFNQRLRSVAELLFREISSTYPYKITPGQLDKHKEYIAFFGKADTLKFVSYANLQKRSGGLSLIELWVDEDEGLKLGEGAAFASNASELDDVELRDDELSAVVFPEVVKIEFRYYERKKKEDEGEWVERWDPRDKKHRLPHSVEVSMSMVMPNEQEMTRRLVIPIMFSGKKV
ncbi:MAG: prepilin-type N-terminal cleavage/methylation domain-containing protein [Deltaproteobacteria bacterium]|nr:prepilin-type N-terminal cleavage/methylation domain-containing protein [Deltaproteobacteria bacterium]